MKVGTKSLLFGVHAFWLHPFVVALAWWRLFGFPWDPRLWVAFIVHDWGYWGCPNMDGEEGKSHPVLGANIMGYLFDRLPDRRWDEHIGYWRGFCLFHSRSIARLWFRSPSMLAAADKLAWSIEPWWLYLPRAWLSGELKEYMTPDREDSLYQGQSAREWYRQLQSYGKTSAYRFIDGEDMGEGSPVSGEDAR